MHPPEPSIVIQRFTEAHLEGVAALYNEPAVCRQVLQMPFQSVEMWRKRLVMDNERRLQLVALQGAEVIGQLGLEQYLRVRQSHVGSLGMGVAPAWQGKGVGGSVVAAAPYQVGSQNCRQYSHTVTVEGRDTATRGAACRLLR